MHRSDLACGDSSPCRCGNNCSREESGPHCKGKLQRQALFVCKFLTVSHIIMSTPDENGDTSAKKDGKLAKRVQW